MTSREFAKTVENRLTIVEQTLRKKQTEYGEEDDRLVQFRKAGFLQDTNPLRALMGMMAKHPTSIYMMATNPSSHPRERWEEKITDHIAYLLLLEGLLVDLMWRYGHDGEE